MGIPFELILVVPPKAFDDADFDLAVVGIEFCEEELAVEYVKDNLLEYSLHIETPTSYCFVYLIVSII